MTGDVSDPAQLREEAVRQGRLADEAMIQRDWKSARMHIERAWELTVQAVNIERQPPTPPSLMDAAGPL
jgi:hypothetical protein